MTPSPTRRSGPTSRPGFDISAPITVAFGARTDTGRVRDHNEDNFLVDKKLHLYVLCDGMGGHAAGAVASATAVNVVHESVVERQELLDRATPRPGDRREVASLVENSVQRACYRIFERAVQNPRERGMGTTLTMLLLTGGRAYLGHVGDSRAYLLRDGSLYQLTEDHSLLNEMVKHGRVRSADDVSERFRNAVTRAVGVHESVEVDVIDLDVLPGDRFLLCSDGLHGLADDHTIHRLVTSAPDEDAACQSLIACANDRGGHDNVTAVVVSVLEVPGVDAAHVRLRMETLRSLVLFRYLTFQELLKVQNIAVERHVEPGGSIFHAGTIEHCAYVVLNGRVRIRKDNVVIAVLESGYHFGEMALVDNTPRTADATAVEATELLVIHRPQFYELMRKNPSLAIKLLWSFVKALTIRLRVTNSELSLVKGLYYSVRPDEVDRLPVSWLQPGEPSEVRARPPEAELVPEPQPEPGPEPPPLPEEDLTEPEPPPLPDPDPDDTP